MFVAIRNTTRVNKGNLTVVNPLSEPTITDWNEIDKAVRVYFDPPENDGGSSIATYYYRLDGGAWVDIQSTSSPFLISGLTNAQEYELEMQAENESVIRGLVSLPVTIIPGESWAESDEIWADSDVIWSD